MSHDIWTPCGGRDSLRSLDTRPWRIVEAQHRIATRPLVDSDADQALLERLIDGVKPPMRDEGGTREGLHYLLKTPFRYPPLEHGSRFGTTREAGVWYGAETVSTALAEKAYYMFRFREDTAADLDVVNREMTGFCVPVETSAGVDLTVAPFADHEAAISSPASYAASQPLGRAMRERGVEAFRFRSARDPGGGINVGLFSPRAFADPGPEPGSWRTWHGQATDGAVIFTRPPAFERHGEIAFVRDDFTVDGRLPRPR